MAGADTDLLRRSDPLAVTPLSELFDIPYPYRGEFPL